jgi:hypothetical protein
MNPFFGLSKVRRMLYLGPRLVESGSDTGSAESRSNPDPDPEQGF